MAMKIDKTGEQFKTNEGYIIEIIKYNKYSDVLVQFQDEHKAIISTRYDCCKHGEISNPYHPSKNGIGFMGVGKYNSRKDKQCYRKWHNLMNRSYNEEYKNIYPTYKDAFVNKEWHNFQNFAEWYYNNYYEIEGETMCLDKDILYKGNKEYAPDKCIFVPERINKLFLKNDADRGDLPIGVTYVTGCNRYQANCCMLNGRKYLGCYETIEKAFQAYKQFKEQYIKEIADEYKDKIPKELYEAMYNWVVEWND